MRKGEKRGEVLEEGNHWNSHGRDFDFSHEVHPLGGIRAEVWITAAERSAPRESDTALEASRLVHRNVFQVNAPRRNK